MLQSEFFVIIIVHFGIFHFSTHIRNEMFIYFCFWKDLCHTIDELVLHCFFTDDKPILFIVTKYDIVYSTKSKWQMP